MINGSFSGNLCGFLYFLIFLLGGIFISLKVFSSQRPIMRVYLGSVLGVALLMWLPVLASFIFGFNLLSHFIALGILIAACVLLQSFMPNKSVFEGFKFDKEIGWMLALTVPMTVFYAIVETNHILEPSDSGGMIFGQSTYYDANIHLSFITTPVVQGNMPFNYNILPSAQVSYPFLCDTISSSVYIWGASLRFAYILPTIVGALNVFAGGFLFFSSWLKSVKKAALAWTLFFFNGGFGFMYFLDGLRQGSANFTRIFDTLYQTPTNLNDKMIRWVNTVCDMMIPQRASLFGWMMLFAILFLLYKAVFEKDKKLFIFAGIFAGLTPMISTHIFVSIAVISFVWLISRLAVFAKIKDSTAKGVGLGILIATVAVFAITCLSTGDKLHNFDYDKAGYYALIIGASAIVVTFIVLLAVALNKGNFKEIASTWGLYLVIVLILALPQLICFTFNQSSNEGFMRPHFNWVNIQDEYIWFYIKNVGMVALLIIPAFLGLSKRFKSVLAPIAVMLLIADTYAFTPNTYDNNKFLYPIYILACGGVAEYMFLLYNKIKNIKGTRLIAIGTIFVCVFSAVLSMGREAISNEYEMYSGNQVAAANWICDNTEGDDTILTNDRYNNAVSSLTGRNVMCGSNSMLYPHGFSKDYNYLQPQVKRIYANADGNLALIEEYSIDYIFVGPDELSSYNVNEDKIKNIASLVFEQGDVRIYKVN